MWTVFDRVKSGDRISASLVRMGTAALLAGNLDGDPGY